MRYFKLLTLSVLVSVSASAAPTTTPIPDEGDAIYLDTYLEVTKKKRDAAYYCELVEKSEKGYHYKAFFMTGELKMEGWYADVGMQTPEGGFTYYYRNGEVESKGVYREGAKVGIWKRYTTNGTEKPEKVYASLKIMKAIEDAKRQEEMND